MAIEINEERKREILNSFIDNKDFYKTSELREVRRVIVDSYYNVSKCIIEGNDYADCVDTLVERM